MPADPIRITSSGVDLSDRFAASTTVVASPAAAAETIIASLTLGANLSTKLGVLLTGWAAYTVGTSGSAVTLKVRQTNVSGTTIVSSGALTGSQHGAAILSADDIQGLDTAPVFPGQVYVLTMQVTAGSAASTVSAVFLAAFAI